MCDSTAAQLADPRKAKAYALYAAPLALGYAEAELRKGGSEAVPRALHILTWLGVGGAYSKPPARQKGDLDAAPAFVLEAGKVTEVRINDGKVLD